MNYKSIFTPYVARNLLRMGNPIFDIKPDKNNSSKTIFIFEETEKLKHDMAYRENTFTYRENQQSPVLPCLIPAPWGQHFPLV